jgi:hypothetical protein
MDVFYKLDIDPSHVIGLYSDLLPSEFINQVKVLHRIIFLITSKQTMVLALKF